MKSNKQTNSKHMSKFLVCISTGLGEYIGESRKLESTADWRFNFKVSKIGTTDK